MSVRSKLSKQSSAISSLVVTAAQARADLAVAKAREEFMKRKSEAARPRLEAETEIDRLEMSEAVAAAQIRADILEEEIGRLEKNDVVDIPEIPSQGPSAKVAEYILMNSDEPVMKEEGEVIQGVVTKQEADAVSLAAEAYSPEVLQGQNIDIPVFQRPDALEKDKVCTSPISNKAENGTMTEILQRLVIQQKEAGLPKPEVPTFSGADILEYTTFTRNFMLLVESKTEDPVRRLELLLKSASGDAHDLIKNCQLITPPAAGYKRAKELLKRDYGQPASIASAYQEKATNWPRIMTGDKESIRKFAIFLTNCSNAKQNNPELMAMDGYEILKILASKLPVGLQQEWIRQLGKIRERELRVPKLEDFETFVGRESRNINDPRVTGLGYQPRPPPTTYKKTQPKKVMATTINSCSHCRASDHGIVNCPQFSKLSIKEKSQVCFKDGLCYGCLRAGHRKQNCPNRAQIECVQCKGKHLTVMHDPNIKSVKKVSTGCVGIDKFNPLMAIVPVRVKVKRSNEAITTYAFINNGCQAVFISEKLNRQLKTQAKCTGLVIKTLNLEDRVNVKLVVDQLQVASMLEANYIDLPSVYVQDNIPVTTKDVPRQNDISKWPHLRQIRLLHVNEVCIPEVTMIIGVNVPAVSMPLEVINGKLGQPYAIRSPLGWLLYGLPGKSVNRQEVGVNFCKVDPLEQQLKEYFNMEFSERLSGSKLIPSVEDKKFLEIMDSTISKVDGHFQVALPLRNQDVVFPNNKLQAEMFAGRLRSKLINNPKLLKGYSEFMADPVSKGYAEEVPVEEVNRNDGRTWFIPHHGVFHQRKPDNLRVVFNFPVTYMGMSLNQELLQGPDLTNLLYGVLLRWRQEPVALLADIEKMFFQVRVRPTDCDLLRYLWWPNGNLNSDLKEYRMRVHIFGAVSSPSCASYVLRKTEIGAENKVAQAVEESFYVDDFLKSETSEEEAIDMVAKMRKLLEESGFNLTKWASNSRKLLEIIPEQHRAKDVTEIDLHNDKLPKEHVLGVKWCAESDSLEFSAKTVPVSKSATRRNILSVVSGIYDPLGICSPYTLQAKFILQSLCREKMGWDDPISAQHQREWKEWLTDLSGLENVRIPRCLKPSNFGEVTSARLHHFADASLHGYGTVKWYL